MNDLSPAGFLVPVDLNGALARSGHKDPGWGLSQIGRSFQKLIVGGQASADDLLPCSSHTASYSCLLKYDSLPV